MYSPIDLGITTEELQEMYLRCRLACGMEAAIYDMPPNVGYYLHDSLIESYVNDWSEEEFDIWSSITYSALIMYDHNDIAKLYKDCQNIIERYAQILYGGKEE